MARINTTPSKITVPLKSLLWTECQLSVPLISEFIEEEQIRSLPSCRRGNGAKQSVGLILVKLVWSCLELVPDARNFLPYLGFRLISNCSVSDEVRVLFMERKSYQHSPVRRLFNSDLNKEII